MVIRHGRPIFIANLKSNTMKNTVQIYSILCCTAWFRGANPWYVSFIL